MAQPFGCSKFSQSPTSNNSLNIPKTFLVLLASVLVYPQDFYKTLFKDSLSLIIENNQFYFLCLCCKAQANLRCSLFITVQKVIFDVMKFSIRLVDTQVCIHLKYESFHKVSHSLMIDNNKIYGYIHVLWSRPLSGVLGSSQ